MALANYTKSCLKNIAGNSLLYVTEASNVTTVTVSNGEVTALTMETSKTFKTVAMDIDTLQRTEEGKGFGTNIYYTHKIEATFSYLSTALRTFRNALADASPCGMIALVKDGNGTWWLVGYNEVDTTNRGLQLVQDNTTSGKKASEEAGGKASIILQSEDGYADLPVKSTSTVAVSGITAA